MIAARPGFIVGDHEIVAWHENGQPMVIGERGLEIKRGTVDDWRHHQIVQVMPATDWLIWRREEDRSSMWSDPLVGWALCADGAVRPLETDSSGVTDLVTGHGFVIRHARDGRPPSSWFDNGPPTQAPTQATEG